MRLLNLLPLTTSALALATPLKRNIPNLQARHKSWPTQSWYHNTDEHRHGRTQTVTITTTFTITVTAPGFPFPTANTTFPNTTSTNDLAPITLITLPSLLPAPTPSLSDSIPTTSTDDLAPITLIDISTLLPTSTGEGDNAAAPTPNDIPPITLINLNTLAVR
ncbi:hypothetical protein EJ02DRAFT_435056 [Clathrospora elynae]|uniref:Uncharacterized protein n=1 Tax=Clathrospora elynae TaxID=706981 RepID=A0A6A5SRA3_9PLEO|nr:hypothetical protein EJ02DRAFT_435056 [Clathrospora elynae]